MEKRESANNPHHASFFAFLSSIDYLYDIKINIQSRIGYGEVETAHIVVYCLLIFSCFAVLAREKLSFERMPEPRTSAFIER